MSNKEKQAVWLYPETKELMMKHMEIVDARSQSDFIEKAIKFYVGYLECSSENMADYLGQIVPPIMDGIVKGAEQRISRAIFKLAVESAMQSHMVAVFNDVDEQTVDKLRGMCYDEVRRINGIIDFKKAYEYQKYD